MPPSHLRTQSTQSDNISHLHAAQALTADVVTVAKAAGDKLRASILKALAQDSFSVQELGEIFSMAQPAISHHLKLLSNAGLVTKRHEGTSHYYQRAFYQTDRDPNAPLIQAIFGALDDEALDQPVTDGIARVMGHRSEQSRAFFATQADALAQQTTLVCAPQVYTEAVLHAALSQPEDNRAKALEVGPGSGNLLNALAPHFDHLIAIDNSAEMLAKTEQAVIDLDNVSLHQQDFSQIPDQANYDLVVAAMVIHHMPAPLAFFKKAAAVLKPTGLLVIAELCQHDQEWVREACGDLRLGFTPQALSQWAEHARLKRTQHHFLAQRNGFRVQVSAFAPNSSN